MRTAPAYSTTAPSAPRMRADAKRNREAIIGAARKLMATHGLDVGMDEIAAEAKVGVGTVYRHFPAKDDLIHALAEDRFQRLTEYAHEALAEDEPVAAFERFLYRGGELQAKDHGLSEVMRSRPDAMQAAAASVGLLELTREVMARAQAAGGVRKDAEAEDIPMMMCGLGTSTPRSSGPFVSKTSWQRFYGIMIAGLRPTDAGPALPPR